MENDLRDEVAIEVLKVLLTTRRESYSGFTRGQHAGEGFYDWCARQSYEAADAMIAARRRGR